MMTEARITADSFALTEGGQVSRLLLAWFDRTRRDLPWRQNKDPYRILLSEIMLQQTQVQTVIPYFEKFLQRWPTLADLSGADEEQVLKNWEGLGYYSRARHLLAAARLIRTKYDGQMPVDEKVLRTLPGIGEYTAAAILAIAFGQPVAAVDGNIVRVFARLTATGWNPADLPQRREVRRLAESILSPERPGDWNEALMDLGATVCLPRLPLCPACPLAGLCLALERGLTSQLPLRPAKKVRPAQDRIVLVLTRPDQVHVRLRPTPGLLAGLYEFDWLDPLLRLPGESAADSVARLFPAAGILALGSLTHDFTHLRWAMTGFRVAGPGPELNDPTGRWVDTTELAALPFPTALAGYREKALALLGNKVLALPFQYSLEQLV
jgi:A/G-specific adenine glycosylase